MRPIRRRPEIDGSEERLEATGKLAMVGHYPVYRPGLVDVQNDFGVEVSAVHDFIDADADGAGHKRGETCPELACVRA